jgi:prevent-host-death family protein
MNKTISSREFNQDVSAAKRAAEDGAVIITDRGRPAHVLMSYAAYEKLKAAGPSLYDVLAPEEPMDFEFDPPKMGDGIFLPVDFEDER